MTRSHIQFVPQADVHSAPFHHSLSFSESRPCGNRLNSTKDGMFKKILQRFFISSPCSGKGCGWEGGKERNVQREFHEGLFFSLFKNYYVLDTVNHLYTHIQEVNLQNSMRG